MENLPQDQLQTISAALQEIIEDRQACPAHRLDAIRLLLEISRR